MLLIRKKAYARAGLVGNPSDGYFGKTLVDDRAQFLGRGDALRVGPDRSWCPARRTRAVSTPSEELVRDVRLHGYYGGIRLVKATIKKFAEYCGRNAARTLQHRRTSPSATRAASRGKWAWPAPAPSSWPRSAA